MILGNNHKQPVCYLVANIFLLIAFFVFLLRACYYFHPVFFIEAYIYYYCPEAGGLVVGHCNTFGVGLIVLYSLIAFYLCLIVSFVLRLKCTISRTEYLSRSIKYILLNMAAAVVYILMEAYQSY